MSPGREHRLALARGTWSPVPRGRCSVRAVLEAPALCLQSGTAGAQLQHDTSKQEPTLSQQAGAALGLPPQLTAQPGLS